MLRACSKRGKLQKCWKTAGSQGQHKKKMLAARGSTQEKKLLAARDNTQENKQRGSQGQHARNEKRGSRRKVYAKHLR
jgi:hypothetical protein